MPMGHSLSIYARFSGKKRISMYESREKGDHYYILSRRNDLFCHCHLFLGKLNPFAPGDFAEKHVLKLVEWFSGHCRAIKS